MRNYAVKYNKRRGTWVVKRGVIGATLKSAKTCREALDFVKMHASDRRNRPSRVRLYNIHGGLLREWGYKSITDRPRRNPARNTRDF